jgi:hypothetical protein
MLVEGMTPRTDTNEIGPGPHQGGTLEEDLARPKTMPDPELKGWKRRGWLFGIPQHQVFDNRGNIGPTLWWDGEMSGAIASSESAQRRCQ